MTTENTNDKNRMQYLLDIYKMYQSHINSMLNYYLILAGLFINAYVQSYKISSEIDMPVDTVVATFASILSIIFLLIHIRSRSLLDTIESALRKEEGKLFGNDIAFLNYPTTNNYWFYRHKNQFVFAYIVFIILFIFMAIFSSPFNKPIIDTLSTIKNCVIDSSATPDLLPKE